MDIIRQEIDNPQRYFTHSIITETGWVMSQGGSQYDNDSLSIEASAGNMILSDNISMGDLTQVQNVLKKFEYGHFLIKSPDGRYGVVFYDSIYTGILHPGEFLVVPNVPFLFRGGNYKDYNSNPIDAINEICFYDDTGWNKRNFYSYYIKPHDVGNSLYWGADTFAANDNGHGAGLNISHIVTYFYYDSVYYPPSQIPELPEKMYVGTHIFKNQKIDRTFELADNVKNALVGKDTDIHYRIYDIDSSNTLAFSLDENLEFIDAELSCGSYDYDTNNHTLYWQVRP